MGRRTQRWILSVVLLTLAGAATVAPPPELTYQGLLLDPQGAPLAGPVTLTIGVFELAEGGEPLYQELHPSVSLANGLFSILLGAGTSPTGPFDAALFADGNRWLEVTVDDGSGLPDTLEPRQAFKSVAYALQSQVAVFAETAGNAATLGGVDATALDQAAELQALQIEVETLRTRLAALACGNEEIDLPEECDGSNLGGETCVSLGFEFIGGFLVCDPADCTFDIFPCTCGSSVCDAGEDCSSCPGDCGCDANGSCVLGGCICNESFAGDGLTCTVDAQGCRDGIDNDGDGVIDCDDSSCQGAPCADGAVCEGAVCCADSDLDGFGDPSCGGTDCDDADPDINPGAIETWYDGVDQNCDGKNDFDQDFDFYVHADFPGEAGGSAPNVGDCLDTNPSVRPTSGQCIYQPLPYTTEEGLDSFDYNCDGIEQEQFPTTGRCTTNPDFTCSRTGGFGSPKPACGETGLMVVDCEFATFSCSRILGDSRKMRCC